MTQATIHTFDACRHGASPGECANEACINSVRAKHLYEGEAKALRFALSKANERIRKLEVRLAAATESRPMGDRGRALKFADIVGAIYGLSAETVLSGDRHKCPAEARKVLYYVCRSVPVPEWSYPEIGLAVGRDHATVMTGVRVATERLQCDPEFASRVQRALYAARVAEGQVVDTIALRALPEIPDLEVSR